MLGQTSILKKIRRKKDGCLLNPLLWSGGDQKKSKNTYTRTQLPLRLAWAITIHKSQGITIHGKYCLDIGLKELNNGMTYVAFSRATKFSDIGLIRAFTGSRVNTINNNRGNQVRIKHEKDLELLSRETRIRYKELEN